MAERSEESGDTWSDRLTRGKGGVQADGSARRAGVGGVVEDLHHQLLVNEHPQLLTAGERELLLPREVERPPDGGRESAQRNGAGLSWRSREGAVERCLHFRSSD